MARSARVERFGRIFFIGGAISFRALFNWIRPAIYIPTMLGSPLFQILFFAHLGRFSGVGDDTFFVVGNGVQVCAMSSIYGMTMAIANERYFGTLSTLLATPANRLALFLGRGIPVIANGLLVSAFGFLVGIVLLDFSVSWSSVPALAATVVVTVFSCTALGMLIGSIGLRARDVFIASNLAYFLMLLFTGANIPIGELPGWMEAIGRSIPLTHGIEAARGLARGETFGSVSDQVLIEGLIGVAYAIAAYLLFKYLEVQSRRSAALDRV